ncbi:LON peptidase N-terminal domain and RING finger protein 1-like [Tubulanus polymorphus]|uniref:LON peptidase N-terminal domain and RING finger protein 1-like n=1 Tax=Tubulanus polymorphus TaxID=672921 RepID=UPI003DA2CED5
MESLAREAFSSKNYDLAADIYQRNIIENGPKFHTYLGLADSYSRAGEFNRALEAYTTAIRIDPKSVQPKHLEQLVTGLVEFMDQNGGSLLVTSQKTDEIDLFSCSICRGLLVEPVTLPCGHSFCRPCLIKDGTKRCKKCSTVHYYVNVAKIKSNILLLATIEKLFTAEVKASKLKCCGNELVSQGKYEEAIDTYTQALDIAPKDHLIYSNRAHAFTCLKLYEESLDDAGCAVRIRPDWSKGYYRKGVALSGMGCHEEAARAYLQCLALDSSVKPARTALTTELYNILRCEIPAECSTSMKKHVGMFELPCRSVISQETVRQLKTALRDSMLSAGCFTSQAVSTSNNSASSIRRCNSFPDASRLLTDNSLFSSADHLNNGAKKRTRNGDQKNKDSSSKDKESSSSPTAAATTEEKRTETTIPSRRMFRNFDVDLLSKDDFECSLCFRMLYQPVATPCGHVFCRRCLDRCLDYNTNCPLCKSSLTEYLAERRQATVEAIEMLMTSFYPMEYEALKKQHEEEVSALTLSGKDGKHEIPVFVCTASFPTVTCPLHVFEPRYRLMVRQCMESGTRQFGMCVPRGPNESDFADVGTMLEIRNVQFFADGRSIVDTIGGRRFRVLTRGMKDGYHTATVEFINDIQPVASDIEGLRKICDEVYDNSKTWFESLGSAQSRITSQMGPLPAALEPTQPLPENGPAWLWWVIAVLPLDPRAQASILAMTSLKDRLNAIKNVLVYLKRRGS